jgi:two-component system, chemotaxis family, chemotaxis protein CheY
MGAGTPGPEGEHTPTKRRLRILYADDMPELRDVVSITLSREGHQVECAEDGAVALGKISAGPPFDVLITDHHMPQMNGIELVRQLRSVSFPGKIMIFSSELSRDVNMTYRELNVDGILYKPVFPIAIRQMLDELYTPVAATPR